MIHLIQGIWFQERGGLGIAFGHTGDERAIWQTAMRPFMFAGVFGPRRDNPAMLVGYMTDQVGESSLTDIRLTKNKFFFTKQYEDREYLIHYKFRKQPDGTWSGEWSIPDEAGGKGQARCVLTQVTDEFFTMGEEELVQATSGRMKRTRRR